MSLYMPKRIKIAFPAHFKPQFKPFFAQKIAFRFQYSHYGVTKDLQIHRNLILT